MNRKMYNYFSLPEKKLIYGWIPSRKNDTFILLHETSGWKLIFLVISSSSTHKENRITKNNLLLALKPITIVFL